MSREAAEARNKEVCREDFEQAEPGLLYSANFFGSGLAIDPNLSGSATPREKQNTNRIRVMSREGAEARSKEVCREGFEQPEPGFLSAQTFSDPDTS